MGMFDTVCFDKAYTCPLCHGKIDSIQVKEFENVLENYRVKDCPSHAEEIRIIKDELFCDTCSKHIGKSIYIVVGRGILLGIVDTLEEAKKLLNDLNLEKLVLWYHDLYRRYMNEQKEKNSYRRFLNDLREWYGERLHERPEDDLATKGIWFIWNSRHLKGALNPVESVERFMTYKKMIKALDELWEAGHQVLDVYYPEEVSAGEERWSVDVYQDEINERCHLNWTWTVVSEKQLEVDGEKESQQPDWVVIVEEPFSDEVVCQAVGKWLRDRGYEFGVKMISPEQARGSGLIKKLKETDIESEKMGAVSMETVMKELDEEEDKRMAGLIESRKDKKRVFYYKGFYGSLVPDVESDRLLGKIEGVEEDIVYQGKTVKECEQRFREAVSRYKKIRGSLDGYFDP
ncbi:hypothetical protein HKBW3S43_00648 [Candidatus Hakubella thermalkaliphila]|uniref:Uncharacterized protein n=6 Tax=Candidatus Hakubella thermalkaliphila TaxID=2754717 RepID=A0A6V8PV13_9ACTN|nr:hypothetical protein HKBW3S43_00648 [Candidatus Hakubella thermalkaliphila]